MEHRILVGLGCVVFLLHGCATPTSQLIDQARQHDVPVVVSTSFPGLPNSAGGVNANISFVNASNRTLKYVHFSVTPYNRVGDIAPSEIGRRATTLLRATGPYEPGKGNVTLFGPSNWENVWYNHSIRCMQIDKIEVTYMDDQPEVVEGDRLRMAMAPEVRNSCAL